MSKLGIKIIKRGAREPATAKTPLRAECKPERPLTETINGWVREMREKKRSERQTALQFLFGKTAAASG